MTAADDTTANNRTMINEFARLFYSERDVSQAFQLFVRMDYIQHNPNILDGREAAIEALTDKFAAPGASFEILRILVDGDLAVIHVKATRPGSEPTAVADIYRISDGLVVEHWDVLQTRPVGAVNPAAMF